MALFPLQRVLCVYGAESIFANCYINHAKHKSKPFSINMALIGLKVVIKQSKCDLRLTIIHQSSIRLGGHYANPLQSINTNRITTTTTAGCSVPCQPPASGCLATTTFFFLRSPPTHQNLIILSGSEKMMKPFNG